MSTARDRRLREALESPLVSGRLARRRQSEAEIATQAKQILTYRKPHITRSVSKTSGLVRSSPKPLYNITPHSLQRSQSSFSPGDFSPRHKNNSLSGSRNTLAVSDNSSISDKEGFNELLRTPSDGDTKELAARSILEEVSKSIVRSTMKESATSPLEVKPLKGPSFVTEGTQVEKETPDPVAAWLSAMKKKEKNRERGREGSASVKTQTPEISKLPPPLTPVGSKQVRIEGTPPTTARQLFSEQEARAASKGSAWDMTPKAQRFPSVPSTGSPSPKELILGLDMSAAASAKALYDYLKISPSPRMRFDELEQREPVSSVTSPSNSPTASEAVTLRRKSNESDNSESSGRIRKLIFLEESTRRTLEWGETISRCHVAYVSDLNDKVCVAVQQKAKLAGHLANAEGKWRLRLLMEVNSTPSGKHLQSPTFTADEEDSIENTHNKTLVMSVALDFLEEHEQSCRHEIIRMELLGRAVQRISTTHIEHLREITILYKMKENIHRRRITFYQKHSFLKLQEVMKRSLLYVSYKHSLKSNVLQRKYITTAIAISSEENIKRIKLGLYFTELSEVRFRSDIQRGYCKQAASIVVKTGKTKKIINQSETIKTIETEEESRREILESERRIFQSIWNISQRSRRTIQLTAIQMNEGTGRLQQVEFESITRLDLLHLHTYLVSEEERRRQITTEQTALFDGIHQVFNVEAFLVIEKQQADVRNSIAMEAMSSTPSLASNCSPIRVRPSRAAPRAPSASQSLPPSTRESNSTIASSRMPTRSPPKPPSGVVLSFDSNSPTALLESSIEESQATDSSSIHIDDQSPDTSFNDEDEKSYAEVMRSLRHIREDDSGLEWRSTSHSTELTKSSWEWGSNSHRRTASQQQQIRKQNYPSFKKTTTYQQRFNKYNTDQKWEKLVDANIKTTKTHTIQEGHFESIVEVVESKSRNEIVADESLQRQATTLHHLSLCRKIRKNATLLKYTLDDEPLLVSVIIDDEEVKKRIPIPASQEETERYLKRYEKWKSGRGIIRDEMFELNEIKVKTVVFDDPSDGYDSETLFEPEGLQIPAINRKDSISNLTETEDGNITLSPDKMTNPAPQKRVITRRGGIPAASAPGISKPQQHRKPVFKPVSRSYSVPLRGARKAAAEAAAKKASHEASKFRNDIGFFRSPLPASVALAIDSEEAKARIELIDRERIISGQFIRTSVALCEKAGAMSGEELIKTITEVTDRIQKKSPPYDTYWKHAFEKRKRKAPSPLT